MSFHSTPTVAGVHYISAAQVPLSRYASKLSVYREKSFCDVPLFGFDGGVRPRCQFISMGRKIYALGGLEKFSCQTASGDVYVFDPVGASRWSKCASMKNPRMSFGLGALNGEIFVFGGCHCGKFVYECEAYDPNKNTWRKIANMLEPRMGHQVALLGEQFWIYGGRVYPKLAEDSDSDSPFRLLGYHPGKNEWVRYPDGTERTSFKNDMFMANGNFHRFTPKGNVSRYDLPRHSWSAVHSISALQWKERVFDRPDHIGIGLGGHAIPLGAELLTVTHLGQNKATAEACLLETEKFGGEDEEIVLDIVSLGPEAAFELDSTKVFPLDL